MFHLKPDVMKKLQLKKEVIASLERSQMGALKGGDEVKMVKGTCWAQSTLTKCPVETEGICFETGGDDCLLTNRTCQPLQTQNCPQSIGAPICDIGYITQKC
jgi:natural product precursor